LVTPEGIYDDRHSFSIGYKDRHFVYGQTFSGRYLLVLVRVLSLEEILKLGFRQGTNVLKIITARDMNSRHIESRKCHFFTPKT